jgi:hypothetical protein
VLGTVSWGRWEPRACGTSLPPFLKSLGRRSSVCTRGVTLHVPLTPQLPALHASFFNPGSASAAATAAAAVPPVPSAESLGEEVGEEGEGVQGTERRRWVLFRMPPPPWARSYLAWCRIQLA